MHPERWAQPDSAAQKLKGLTEIPAGFGFDAASVWGQLESRLQPVREKPFVSRWWMAAAVFLLAVAGWIGGQKEEALKPAETAKTSNLPIAAMQPSLQKGKPQQKARIAVAPKPLLTKEGKAETIVVVEGEPALAIANDTPALINTVAPPLMTETATVTAPQPRFRIAHANELRTPVVPAQLMNDAAKPTYGFLRRPVADEAPMEANVIEPTPKKQPKTLMGLFNSN